MTAHMVFGNRVDYELRKYTLYHYLSSMRLTIIQLGCLELTPLTFQLR